MPWEAWPTPVSQPSCLAYKALLHTRAGLCDFLGAITCHAEAAVDPPTHAVYPTPTG